MRRAQVRLKSFAALIGQTMMKPPTEAAPFRFLQLRSLVYMRWRPEAGFPDLSLCVYNRTISGVFTGYSERGLPLEIGTSKNIFVVV